MATATKRKRARTAHLRQTDLSTETGLRNARVKLGKNLRGCRQALKLSQSEVGKAVDLDQSTIAQVEAGTYAPGFESLLRIAHALKSTPSALFTGVRL